jgi:hypothetical protein
MPNEHDSWITSLIRALGLACGLLAVVWTLKANGVQVPTAAILLAGVAVGVVSR